LFWCLLSRSIPVCSAVHRLSVSSPEDNSDHKFVCKVVGLSKCSDSLSRVDDLQCDKGADATRHACLDIRLSIVSVCYFHEGYSLRGGEVG
jgi:pyruvate-formate lyase